MASRAHATAPNLDTEGCEGEGTAGRDASRKSLARVANGPVIFSRNLPHERQLACDMRILPKRGVDRYPESNPSPLKSLQVICSRGFVENE
jgi:hypothetical protein